MTEDEMAGWHAFYSLNKNMIHTINLLSGKAKQYWHYIN